jgi:hypothetical protein
VWVLVQQLLVAVHTTSIQVPFTPVLSKFTSKVKTNILGSVIFFWANFQHLATKKWGNFGKFSLLKCELDPKKMLGFI